LLACYVMCVCVMLQLYARKYAKHSSKRHT
jgi:hypothetical protein